jgi:hypothetical protein
MALVCAATFALAPESFAKSKANPKPAPTPNATPHGTKRVEKESKAWKGEKDGKPGYWFQFVTTTFEWQAYVEVVALYRRVTDNWVSDLKSKYLEASRGKNEADVRKVAAKTGYDKLLNYVESNARSSKSKADSIGIVLLDKNTGEIVGTIPVKNADDASSWMSDAMKGERSVTLKGGAKEDIKLSGYIWHASPIVLDLGRLGHPDLLAGPDWGLQPGRKIASAAVREFDLDGTGEGVWEWVGPKSGLLVWDPGARGQIRSGKQLFGNYTWGKQWKDGYEALATLDRNGDGKLTGFELPSLRVWVDADSDGISTPAEVSDLAHLGIEEIAIDATRTGTGAWHAAGFKRRAADGTSEALATWDWIALGKPRPTDGTYVWVGKEDGKDYGGYLRLSDDGGVIGGLSFPTVGNDIGPPEYVVALPVWGQVENGTATWRTPAPDGEIVSTVTWTEGGKHLYGRTVVHTADRKSDYAWQAELIAGKPIGAGPNSGRSVGRK